MTYQRSPGHEDKPLDVVGLMTAVMAQVDLIRLAKETLNKDSLPMKFKIIVDLDLKCFDIEVDDDNTLDLQARLNQQCPLHPWAKITCLYRARRH